MGDTKADQSNHMHKYKRDLPGALTGRPQGKSSATKDEVIMTGQKNRTRECLLDIHKHSPSKRTNLGSRGCLLGVSIYFDLC